MGLDFGYSLNIIEIALKKTTSKVNPNFDYLNKLISDWYDKGLKTPEQVQKYISDMKVKQKTYRICKRQLVIINIIKEIMII